MEGIGRRAAFVHTTSSLGGNALMPASLITTPRLKTTSLKTSTLTSDRSSSTEQMLATFNNSGHRAALNPSIATGCVSALRISTTIGQTSTTVTNKETSTMMKMTLDTSSGSIKKTPVLLDSGVSNMTLTTCSALTRKVPDTEPPVSMENSASVTRINSASAANIRAISITAIDKAPIQGLQVRGEFRVVPLTAVKTVPMKTIMTFPAKKSAIGNTSVTGIVELKLAAALENSIKNDSNSDDNNDLSLRDIMDTSREVNKFFFTVQSYQFKTNAKTGKPEYKCEICFETFLRDYRLKRHYIARHINVNYISKSDLEHLNVTFDHNSNWTGIKQTAAVLTVKNQYRCHLCNQLFEMSNMLCTHLSTHTYTDQLTSDISQVAQQESGNIFCYIFF